MSNVFATLLIAHVILGLISVILLYALLLGLLKKEINIDTLKRLSLFNFLALVASWVSGGYYYVLYYGANVKPVIMKGAYTWAHAVIMEAKEHVFLMLPFASLALLVVLYLCPEDIKNNENVKHALVGLVAVLVIVSTLMAISGVLISGGAR